jgi:ribulose-phosphate 3-epimerase
MPVPPSVYNELHLLPSILSADFSNLGQEISRVMDAGVRMIHVDVMDGHFVPNITAGPVVVKAVAPLVHERDGHLSVHLMIEKPEDYLEAFIKAGADAVSVHVETCTHLYHTVQSIRRLGAGAGVAINPGTALERVEAIVPLIDYALVMTVNPGFGGQRAIPSAMEKVPRARQMMPAGTAVEVDGGIHAGNIRQVVEAGANWIVAGSAVYGAADPGAEASRLRGLMTASA